MAPGAFRAHEVREDERVTAWRSALDRRKKRDRVLLRSYDRVVAQLKQNFLHGEVVPVPRDPRFEGVSNLRCEDLAGFHRMLYTNVRVEEGVIVFILDVVAHREYDRLFGGRKK